MTSNIKSEIQDGFPFKKKNHVCHEPSVYMYEILARYLLFGKLSLWRSQTMIN